MSRLLGRVGCSRVQLLSALHTFTHSLAMTAASVCHEQEDSLVDTEFHHFWTVPKGTWPEEQQESAHADSRWACSCGLISQTAQTDWEAVVTRQSDAYALGAPVIKESRRNMDSQLKERLAVGTVLLDSFPACISALQTAVLTANTVLRIVQTIQDVN
jgi:hypothetical protein